MNFGCVQQTLLYRRSCGKIPDYGTPYTPYVKSVKIKIHVKAQKKAGIFGPLPDKIPVLKIFVALFVPQCIDWI